MGPSLPNVCEWLYILKYRLPPGSKARAKIEAAIEALHNSPAKDNQFDCFNPL